jgi:hypothetical protein
MPRSSEWSLSFGLLHQNLVHFSLLSHTCHMLCPFPPPWFDLPSVCAVSVDTNLFFANDQHRLQLRLINNSVFLGSRRR